MALQQLHETCRHCTAMGEYVSKKNTEKRIFLVYTSWCKRGVNGGIFAYLIAEKALISLGNLDYA